MNVLIGSYITFEGDKNELMPLVDDIAEALVKHGFGNEGEDESDVLSIVTIGESGISKFTSAAEFVRMVVQEAFTIIIPLKEETDDTGNQWEGSSED